MKRGLIAVFIFFLTISGFCQTFMADSGTGRSLHFFQPGKIDWGLTLGSEFTSVSGFGSGLGTQVTPHFSYNVSPRFRIGGGISVVTTQYFNARPWFQNEQTVSNNGNFTNAAIFVSGQYLVNDRLSITGSAFKLFPVTKDPLPYNPFNPVSQNGAQGVNFNVGYKVGKNMYIQAGFRYSQGLNPYNYNANRYSSDPFQSGSLVPGFGSGNPTW